MIELKHVSKVFPTAEGGFHALKDVSLTIGDGDIYGIVGMSGAGKSTLVRCINLLERPTSGQVVIDGADLCAMGQKELIAQRRSISMIFQQFNLLMQRTCLKNICFPMEIARIKRADAEKRARELLEIVGLPDKADAYPAQLSGGQKQRVAVARALITEPRIVLADEPTGALDSKATDSLLNLFDQVNSEGQTILMVTHSTKAASHAKRVMFIRDGEVFHQIYKGVSTTEEMYQKISDTLTLLAAGGEEDA